MARALAPTLPEDFANDYKAYAALQGKTQREIVIAFNQRCIRRGREESEAHVDGWHECKGKPE